MNNITFRYADPKEQLKSMNKLLCITTTIINLLMLLITSVSYMLGDQTLVYTIVTFIAMAATTLGGFIILFKNKSSQVLRYFILIGLFIITGILIWGFEAYYVRFLAVLPFVGCVLYFDTKFSTIATIVVSVENIAFTILFGVILKHYEGDQTLGNTVAALAVMVMMCVILYLTKVGKSFNGDSLGKVEHNANLQKEMLDDVLQIAEQIRSGTEGAMDIVNELQSSTDIVNQSVNDISESTISTAESIQNQSEMTQSIQNKLEQSVIKAEHMVEVVKHSSDINNDSNQKIALLREEAINLAEINRTVSDSMKHLQQNVNNVKEITKTIFGISSQTNLLALNASIESARAGEAGRRFAVVADEIRGLSEKTRIETENISSILENLATGADETANAIARSLESGDMQEQMIMDMANQIETMSANVNQLVLDIEEIKAVIGELSNDNTDIVDSISTLSAASEEVTAATQQSTELTAHTSESANTAKALLEKVIAVSHEMDKYL